MSRYFAVFLAVAACATNSESPSTQDAGPGSGSASCEAFVPRLSPGAVVDVASSAAGNPQRDYCAMVPSGSSQIRLDLTGGDCGAFSCVGDDMAMYLKRGAVPDAFDPDASTTAWTYTPDPNGFGTFVKSTQPGPWYLALIDDQNTLGYRGVKMTLTFQ
jgi:hypothetical protein